MNLRSLAICAAMFCNMCAYSPVVHGAIAIDQITDINDNPGFGGLDIFDSALIGVDDTAVFMGNDIAVYTLVADGSGGSGFSVPLSNGENGITETQGGANIDIDNAEPPHPVFAAIGNASGKLENGNAIRFSMWMRMDPNAPVTKEPSVEPVVKIELWKEALSGNSDFAGAQFSGSGDRVWDTDQNASNAEHVAAGQSQADWVDMNNDGDIQNGGNPISQALVPNEWRRVETTLVVDDDPLDDGLGWRIGEDFFTVADIEEIRAVMFVGDFAGSDITDGGSFFVDNLMVEVFANEAAMMATENPNTAPVDGPQGVPGDYNNNGVVDAADYVLWRDGGPLQNEGASIGMIDQGDYDFWRAQFGEGAGAGAAVAASVPEPCGWAIVLCALTALAACRNPKQHAVAA
jgi:hypothetical protein